MAFNLISPGGMRAGAMAAQLAKAQPQTQYADPAQIERLKHMAAILKEGGQRPADSGLGAASNIAQALAGKFQERRAGKLEGQNTRRRQEMLAALVAAPDDAARQALFASAQDPTIQKFGLERTLSQADETRGFRREDEMYQRSAADRRAEAEAQRKFELEQAERKRAHDIHLQRMKSNANTFIPPDLSKYLSGGDGQGGERRGKTLYEMVPEAVGIGNSAQDFLNKTVVQAVPQAFEPKTSEAREGFKLVERDLIRAFSINPRFPVAEQNRILSLVPQATALESVPNAQEALKAIDRELENQIVRDLQLLQSGTLDKEDQSDMMMSVRLMDQLREKIGAPQGDAGTNGQSPAPDAPRIVGVDDYSALPAGAEYIDPNGVRRVKGGQ